jgi:hypothetical protein
MKAPTVVICRDRAHVGQAKIEALKDLLANHPGSSDVRLRIKAPDTGVVEFILDETCGVAYTAELSEAVTVLLGYSALQTRSCDEEHAP